MIFRMILFVKFSTNNYKTCQSFICDKFATKTHHVLHFSLISKLQLLDCGCIIFLQGYFHSFLSWFWFEDMWNVGNNNSNWMNIGPSSLDVIDEFSLFFATTIIR